jgi:hypothetical protein
MLLTLTNKIYKNSNKGKLKNLHTILVTIKTIKTPSEKAINKIS